MMFGLFNDDKKDIKEDEQVRIYVFKFGKYFEEK
jgi:hypothetical protein